MFSHEWHMSKALKEATDALSMFQQAHDRLEKANERLRTVMVRADQERGKVEQQAKERSAKLQEVRKSAYAMHTSNANVQQKLRDFVK